MTIRLDLRKRVNVAHPGEAWRDRPILAAEPYGCADCGRWFAFATGPDGLVAHLCRERRTPLPAEEANP